MVTDEATYQHTLCLGVRVVHLGLNGVDKKVSVGAEWEASTLPYEDCLVDVEA